MKHLGKSAAVSLLLAGTALSSAQAKDIDYLAFQSLFDEPVTTGATGTPQRASEVPLNMTILTAEDIRRSAARTIPDILRRVPGLNVRQNNVSTFNVGIRGYNQALSERILVLVDGRQVYQDYFGSIDWSLIPVTLTEIKQIEVIKGPNTALYGFNATSGVINIITYNPRFDDVSNVYVSGGTGRYGETGGTVTVRNERGGIRFSGSGYTQSQFDTDSNNYDLPAIDTANDSRFLKAVASYEVIDGVDIGFEVTEAKSNIVYVVPTRQFEVDNATSSAKVTAAADTDFGTWSFFAYRNKSDPEFEFVPDRPKGSFDLTHDVVQLSNVFKVGADHTFRLQGEYRSVSGNGVNDRRIISYDVKTGSGLWNWQITDQVLLSNAVRFDSLSMERDDDDPRFDRDMSAVSVNSGLVYKPSDFDTVRLTYARAVDLPSFVELNLRPDSDISVVHDVGIGYTRDLADLDAQVSVNLFRQWVSDMQTGSAFTPGDANPIDSSAFGGELELSGHIAGGWDWGLGYAYVKTDDDISPTAPRDLWAQYEDTQSEHMLSGRLGYAVSDWTFDAYMNYASGFDIEFPNNPVKVDGVLLGSGKINYQVRENVNLSLTGMVGLSGQDYQGAGQKVENSAFATIKVEF